MADGDVSGEGITIVADPPAQETNQDQQGSGGPEGPSGESTTQKGTGWRKQLAEDLQSESRLDKFDGEKALDKVVRSYLEAETRLNEPLKRPGENATEEEWSRYYQQIGRPESPEGYDFSDVDLPDGYTMGEETEKLAREIAYREGFTPDQAKAVVRTIAERDAAAVAAIQRKNKQALKSGLEALQSEWGDNFEANRQQAHQGIEKVFGKEFLGIVLRSGLDQYAPLLKGGYNVARMTAEGTAPRGDGHETTNKYAEAAFPMAAQIADKMRNRT